MSKTVVMFDFDGVIIDSLRSALRLARELKPKLTEDEFRAFFQKNINDSFFATFPPEVKDQFFKKYNDIILHHPIFEGVGDVIKELAKKHILVVVSSTPSQQIFSFLTYHNLMKCFSDIWGNDAAESKVEKFQRIFLTYESSSNHSVFITDTVGDLREAHSLSIPTIAVSWGYHPHTLLIKESPAFLVDKPKDIPHHVASLLS